MPEFIIECFKMIDIHDEHSEWALIDGKIFLKALQEGLYTFTCVAVG